MQLPSRLYETLQNAVHRGHRTTFETLTRFLNAHPGDRVLEVGCGTGQLARPFVEHGFDYWGIDPDPDRIAYAQQIAPSGRFLVGDHSTLAGSEMPRVRHVFIHGVLHHLDDEECRRLLNDVLSLQEDLVLAVAEPYCPDNWWSNQPGYLFAQLDEGRFVRTRENWLELFGPKLELSQVRSLWPRWPVPMIDAKLRTAPPAESATESLSREETAIRRSGQNY